MEFFQNTTVRQCQTCNGCPVKVHLFDVGTARYVYCLRQIRTVPNIDLSEKYVITQVELGQVAVAVRAGGITDLELLEFQCFGEIRVADHKSRKVTHRCQLR